MSEIFYYLIERAQDTSLSEEELEEIYRRSEGWDHLGDSSIRWLLAKNPSSPPWLQIRCAAQAMLDDKEYDFGGVREFLCGLLERTDLDAEQLDFVADHIRYLAEEMVESFEEEDGFYNENDVKLLDRLVSIVASHANTPVSVFERLASSRGHWALEAIARNPKTPVSILEKLATDEYWGVRQAVAENPNTPASALETLATDEDSDVRVAVVANPNTPASALETLATDSDNFVRWCVAKNPNTPASALETLATDSANFVRWCVAKNPNTPVSALELLKED